MVAQLLGEILRLYIFNFTYGTLYYPIRNCDTPIYENFCFFTNVNN